MNRASTALKNKALKLIAKNIESHIDTILIENKRDLQAFADSPLADRLMLNADRLVAIAAEVTKVAELADEVGKVIDEKQMPNGLRISRVRVPFGVVGMIYESRPNVTVDASVLALKSGNAIILKGGKESLHTNRILAAILRDSLSQAGLPAESVQFLDTTDRDATKEMLLARGLIDVIIPRGGKGLIRFCLEHARVPVIETGASVVHTYVDHEVKLDEALAIIVNAKMRRVSVCNALDTLLVHHERVVDFLPLLAERFSTLHETTGMPLVEIHADVTAMATLASVSYPRLFPVTEADFETEWLDYKLNITVVDSLDAAIRHIRKFSLGHSEAICSTNPEAIESFLQEIDAACVYANASTAFSDGAQFGLGTEIGISTQKLHARGPFALEALTSYKWIVRGTGQTRA